MTEKPRGGRFAHAMGQIIGGLIGIIMILALVAVAVVLVRIIAGGAL